VRRDKILVNDQIFTLNLDGQIVTASGEQGIQLLNQLAGFDVMQNNQGADKIF
jgi:hypothetical protein